MFKRLTIVALFSVLLASAKTHTIHISDDAQAGNAQLKAGEYSLKLDGSQAAVLTDKAGRPIGTPTKVETVERKYPQTSIMFSKADGTNRLLWIQLGGTYNRVVFE